MKARGAPDPFETLSAIEVAVATALDELSEALENRQLGLNTHEIMLLGTIRDGETIGSVVDRRAVAVKNISLPLKRLVKTGHITVKSHESDRRRRVVRRTAKGRAAVEHATPIIADLLKKHVSRVKLP